MTRPDVTAGPIERKRIPEKTAVPIGSGVGVGVGVGAGVGVGVGEGVRTVAFVESPEGVGVGDAEAGVGGNCCWVKIDCTVNSKKQSTRNDRRNFCTVKAPLR